MLEQSHATDRLGNDKPLRWSCAKSSVTETRDLGEGENGGNCCSNSLNNSSSAFSFHDEVKSWMTFALSSFHEGGYSSSTFGCFN